MYILEEGETADSIVHATRLAFLIDTDAYFRAFASGVVQARRWVGALAWDVDSRVRLGAGGWDHALPERLGPFLDAVVRGRPELQVNVLSWAPAAIYAFERELGVRVKLGWSTHERLHFRLDDTHAPTACHHQKVVVVDDVLGFLGGIDLTSHRWDTPSHAPHDERRVTTRGKPYAPYHDVQVAVSGPVARALGDLVRERWRRHTGTLIPSPPPGLHEVWPAKVGVDVEDVEVGLIYTDPDGASRGTAAVLVRAIERAKRSIYIENQYLTSRTLTEALCARLRERDGPELIVVAPRRCEGWFEESTMGVLRAEVLAALVEADRFGRLRAVYPRVGNVPVFVHAKLLVTDESFAYVGSANFTDRSFGFDTEAGIGLEADGRADVSRAIGGLRDRLLGEHLGLEPERLRRHLEGGGTAREVLDEAGGGTRGVSPLEDLNGMPAFEWAATLIPMGRPLVDPPEPVGLGHAITEVLERLENGKENGASSREEAAPEVRPSTRGERVPTPASEDEPAGGARRGGRAWRLALVQSVPLFLLAVVGAALWFWTPLRDLSVDDVQRWLEQWRTRPAAFLVVLGVYTLAAIVMAPLNLLQVPVVVAFGPWLGPLYAISGSMLSASLSYGVGRLIGRRPVASLGGQDVQRAASQLSGSGVLAVAVARHVPIAPFPVVNLLAGALEVRFFSYFFGTLLGLLPGAIALGIIGKGVWDLLDEGATPTTVSLFALAALVALGSAWLVRRWFRRRVARGEAGDAD